MLPAPPHTPTIVGIDENTALVIEPAAGECWVQGPGGVTVIRDGDARHFGGGTTFAATELGPFHLPDAAAGLPAEVWADTAPPSRRRGWQCAAQPTPPDAVLALAEARQAARTARDWAEADRLRDEITAAGWTVQDTPDGPVLEPCWSPQHKAAVQSKTGGHR
ncbi:MAG: hypothetical protein R2854_15195 [Caldilineaceae bacterium]